MNRPVNFSQLQVDATGQLSQHHRVPTRLDDWVCGFDPSRLVHEYRRGGCNRKPRNMPIQIDGYNSRLCTKAGAPFLRDQAIGIDLPKSTPACKDGLPAKAEFNNEASSDK